MSEYVVLQRIWHTAEGRYYEPGSVVKLEHLSPDEVEQLVKDGVIEPHRKPVNKYTTTKGEDE
jgi:hypothetical protein